MPIQKVPFRKWVPLWLKVIVAIIIVIPILLINGAYTGSSIDISSSLGVLSEDINMAYYAASAGMAVGYPIVPKIRAIVTTKTMLLSGLMMQVLLCLACALVPYLGVIAVCSFLIGFLKAFTLLEIIFILMPIFSPNDKRSEFYSLFYPISISVGQLSMVLTAWLAYAYQWQHIYYFSIALLLLAMVTVMVCFRYGRRPIRIPFRDIDWMSVGLVSTFFLSFLHVCNYGKVRDWFSSSDIILGTILAGITLVLFIYRQLTSRNPYLDLTILNNRSSLIGYLCMMVMIFFVASSSLISSYVTSVLKLDNAHANLLNICMVPGLFAGAVITFWWYRRHMSFNRLAFGGFLCFVVSSAILYFGVHPAGLYQSLYFPMFLRGVGMMVLFIAFATYAIEDLPKSKRINNAFFLIGIRAFAAPVIFGSLFANWTYRLQWKNMVKLSENIDLQNPMVATQYAQTLSSAAYKGNSLTDSQMLAINQFYGTLQTQSLVLTIKTILGVIVILGIAVLIVVWIFPFAKQRHKQVKIVKTGYDMV